MYGKSTKVHKQQGKQTFRAETNNTFVAFIAFIAVLLYHQISFIANVFFLLIKILR